MARKGRRDKGEGGLYKRSDGMWCAVVELPPGLDGKRRRKTVARKDRGEAQAELRRVRDELDKHGDLSTRSLTLAAWMDYYIEHIAPHRMRPTTLAGVRSVTSGFIKPILGNKKLDRITTDDVRRLHRTILATPKSPTIRALPETEWGGAERLSSTYARNAHNILSGALRTAASEGKVKANVCELVDKPKARATEGNALTRDQARKLIEHLANRPDAALWLTFLLTGARRGEVLGLEVERVGPMLDISWQLQAFKGGTEFSPDFEYRHITGTRYLVRPKTAKGRRVVPAHPFLLAALQRHIGGRASGFVFTNAEGEPYYPTTISKAWKALLADAGLPGHVTLHGARHGFFDAMYAAGVDESVTMDIGGHSVRSVTRGYQVHRDAEVQARAIEAAGDLLLG